MIECIDIDVSFLKSRKWHVHKSTMGLSDRHYHCSCHIDVTSWMNHCVGLTLIPDTSTCCSSHHRSFPRSKDSSQPVQGNHQQEVVAAYVLSRDVTSCLQRRWGVTESFSPDRSDWFWMRQVCEGMIYRMRQVCVCVVCVCVLCTCLSLINWEGCLWMLLARLWSVNPGKEGSLNTSKDRELTEVKRLP